MTIDQLIDHLLETHHATTRTALDELGRALAAENPGRQLMAPWRHFHLLMSAHMDKEEQILFPSIRALAAGLALGPCGLDGPLAQMSHEHDELGTLESALRAAAHLAGPHEAALLALMDDLAVHAAKEEDELFPRARRLLGGQPEALERDPEPAPAVEVVRHTVGMCSTCLETVEADVVVDADGAWLAKTCPEHGESRQLLSRHGEEWADLDRYFFRVNADERPQRDFIVRMTESCNLECPICLARANEGDAPDLDLSGLEQILSERRGVKIDLMAAEPTLRDDLVDWVRRVKASGNIASLHTNGLKLANADYCKELAEAGVDEVFLQFDGFSRDADIALRGRDLRVARARALGNLRRLGVSTSLIAVIADGLNEEQVKELFEFSLLPENDHVKELLFLGLRNLGRARDGAARPGGDLVPDEVIDLLCDQVDGIEREDIRRFNKLYFALLSVFKVRKCHYVQHYLVARDGDGGFTPFADLADLVALEKAAERYADHLERAPRASRMELMLSMARHGVTRRTLRLLRDLTKMQQLLRDGMNLAEVPRSFLLIGFITACDPENFDVQVAAACGKGELSTDGGFTESGAWANVRREQRVQAKPPG